MPEQQSTVPDIEFDSDLQHLSSVAIGAGFLAFVAAWAMGDLVNRWLGFLAVALVSGYILYGRENDRAKLVFVVYSFAGLVALTFPLLLLSDLVSGRAETVLQPINAVFTGLFLVVAVPIAYLGFRLNGGRGIVQRVRARIDE